MKRAQIQTHWHGPTAMHDNGSHTSTLNSNQLFLVSLLCPIVLLINLKDFCFTRSIESVMLSCNDINIMALDCSNHVLITYLMMIC